MFTMALCIRQPDDSGKVYCFIGVRLIPSDPQTADQRVPSKVYQKFVHMLNSYIIDSNILLIPPLNFTGGRTVRNLASIFDPSCLLYCFLWF